MKNGERKDLYIDDISITVTERQPLNIVDRLVRVNNRTFEKDNNHGTRIEISDLKGFWTFEKLKRVGKETQKLESIFEKIIKKDKFVDFEIGFESSGTQSICLFYYKGSPDTPKHLYSLSISHLTPFSFQNRIDCN